MLKIENIRVEGWEDAIRGMRNPKNSWHLSDSGECRGGDAGIGCENCNQEGVCGHCYDHSFQLGKNDHKLMMTLASGGPVHGKFRRMIIVYADITAPLYWWKEFDTYKVGTVANSCSTMHKLTYKEFEEVDFSFDQMTEITGEDIALLYPEESVEHYRHRPETSVFLSELNLYRKLYLAAEAKLKRDDLTPSERKYVAAQKKRFWYNMIQLLPSSYNQKRTVMFSYEVAANIHQYRRHHKLDEWHVLCDAIEALPFSEIILASEKPETPKETYITDHDRIVMSAYTGILMCPFDDYHKFIEETLGRSVLTHELAEEAIHKELQEKLKPDFLKIIGEPKS